MTVDPIFRPSWWLRSPHLQTILGSSDFRKKRVLRRRAPLDPGAEAHLLECRDGIRLKGFLNEANGSCRGTVVLLHGWEGTEVSNYMLSCGTLLRDRGYRIFRLLFRDHGGTHELNRELFHSCRLGEVIDGVEQALERFGQGPRFVVGFSLGGNFALRVAADAGTRIGLEQVVAVNPVVHPPTTLIALENGPSFYERYYVEKWRRSLRRKSELFPDLFPFDEIAPMTSLNEMTEALVSRFGDFPSADAYFRGYSIAGDRLAALDVPARIITSRDDPVIPVGDFAPLGEHPRIDLDIQDRGGHVAFLQNGAMESWIDPRIASILDDVAVAPR
ncbi:hypothetical protein ABI59_00695 [Acidobacteria bacterium Mor1]|nr:hypothetical protein ABI59_00695 [Acidobacteria bacterium Mor1]